MLIKIDFKYFFFTFYQDSHPGTPIQDTLLSRATSHGAPWLRWPEDQGMEGSGPGGLNTPQSGGCALLPGNKSSQCGLHSQTTLICRRIPFPNRPNHKAGILLINCTGGSRQYIVAILAMDPWLGLVSKSFHTSIIFTAMLGMLQCLEKNL